MIVFTVSTTVKIALIRIRIDIFYSIEINFIRQVVLC